jgi:FKBP-type peptidyl-prolyl cis-trans isomerase
MQSLQKFWPLFLLLGIGVVALALIGLDSNKGDGGGGDSTVTAAEGEEVTTSSGLKYEELKIGTGPAAKKGDQVSVRYTGRLVDTQEVFDSTDKHGGKPLDFPLGAGRVIKGWDEGVAGMKVGGKRKLTIPAKLGYGVDGFPPDIPPNADLEFDVELVGIR